MSFQPSTFHSTTGWTVANEVVNAEACGAPPGWVPANAAPALAARRPATPIQVMANLRKRTFTEKDRFSPGGARQDSAVAVPAGSAVHYYWPTVPCFVCARCGRTTGQTGYPAPPLGPDGAAGGQCAGSAARHWSQSGLSRATGSASGRPADAAVRPGDGVYKLSSAIPGRQV